MTHDSGSPSGMPSMACRVWVGMPMSGLRRIRSPGPRLALSWADFNRTSSRAQRGISYARPLSPHHRCQRRLPLRSSRHARPPRSPRSAGPPPPSGRPVRSNVASCRSALDPSARIRKAYSTSFRLPSSSTTSPMNHSISSRIRSARRQFLLLAEVDQLAVEAVAHRPPLVLLDQVGGVDPEGDVVAPQLPQLGHDRLQDRGHCRPPRPPGCRRRRSRNSSVG